MPTTALAKKHGGRRNVDEEGMAIQGGPFQECDEFCPEKDGKSDHPRHYGQ